MVFRWLFFVAFLAACSSTPDVDYTHLPEAVAPEYDRFFFSEVKPLLDRRCVSCHSCYTAPCQLNLAHMEGIRRGATKIPLYDGSRLSSIEPTRLFIDAHSALEWMQKKEFFPVARTRIDDLSIMESLVTQRVGNTGPVRIMAKDSRECPSTPKEVGAYQEKFPNSGMPYGFPALTAQEQVIISRWLQNGYPKLTAARSLELSQAARPAALVRWEKLLNQSDARHRLVSRYLYEHLYIGHLQLPELAGEFYRIVRSRTAAPQPIDVIATTWPFDSPGAAPFFYRLMKVEETITLKNHLIYPLDNAKWKRWQELFFQDNWELEDANFPSYEAKVAANPFLAYQAMPADSRYRFLLDNSLFFIAAFIKGPVCEGPIAVNVIDEQFHIFFLNPREDLAEQSPDFLARAASDLALPAASKDDPLSGFYIKYKAAQLDFVEQRQKLFTASFPRGMKLDDIWDGDGTNPQAVLTVFRHFDNASVSTGALGNTPKTVWVMDYPIFERMYYLLVAGFDVFGNVFHQASTRMYMDNLRVESEDLFLSFLSQDYRQTLRSSWYRGLAAEESMKYLNPYGGVPVSSQIPYYTADQKKEFIKYVIEERFNKKVRAAKVFPQGHGEELLFALTRKEGAQFSVLPDLTLMVVEGKDGKNRIYSLIHHKQHLNVSFMFGEDGRLVPGEDRIDILPGVYGGFPNFFLRMREDQIPQFVADTLKLQENNQPNLEAWTFRYGISRQDAKFWDSYDLIQSLTDEDRKDSSGILDLSKYVLW